MDPHTRKQLALRAAARAEYVRSKCGIGHNAAVDVLCVAEKRKCEVRFMSLPSLEGAYCPNPGPVIILGSDRPAGRRAFTCSHELGHHEFKHGIRVEELDAEKYQETKELTEFLADMFAAFLLMSQASIRHALKNRGIDPKHIEPIQVFRLASFLGVGYGTLIDHMTWTLRLLTLRQRETLRNTRPVDLKKDFGGSPRSEVVLVDELWRDRAVDLEIGDILVLPKGVVVEDVPRLSPHGVIDAQLVFKAISRGYLRAFNENSGWAVNIRIAPKKFVGLARYRFFADPEEDIV